MTIGEAAEKLGYVEEAKAASTHWPTRFKLPATTGQKALLACRAREGNGLTQVAAANLFGTYSGAVSYVERAIRNDPSLEEGFASATWSPEEGYWMSIRRRCRLEEATADGT